MTRLSGFLEGDFDVMSFKIPRRYIVCVTIVTLVKFFLAVTLYVFQDFSSVDGFWMDAARVEPLIQNEILIESGSKAFRWAYLFLGWDSAWYASITAWGYSFSDQSFAFMPALPILTRLLQVALGSPIVALVICCLVFGVLWIPLYESVAEHYMGKRTAFLSSIVFALSPFTLLFATVAYAEGLFLFFTLVVWKFYLDKMYFQASILSAGAAMVRIPGFIIVLPMVLGLISSRGRGGHPRAFLITVPTVIALVSWVAFMGFSTGDPLALIHNSEWSGMYTLPTYLMGVLPSSGLEALSFPIAYPNIHWLIPISIWGSILLPPLLLWRLRKIDHGLFAYCLVYMIGVLAFGAVVSLPRYMAVLFPLWISFSGIFESRRWFGLFITVVSVVACLVLWVGFLSGVFVG